MRFHGNSMTSRERVEGYMLYRAAELTLRNGYDWFLVVDRNTEHNVRTIVQPNPLDQYGHGYPSWRPNWNIYIDGSWQSWSAWHGGPSLAPQYDVRHLEAFEATAEVQMHKAPIPSAEARGIDARRVLADLGPTIERPKS